MTETLASRVERVKALDEKPVAYLGEVERDAWDRTVFMDAETDKAFKQFLEKKWKEAMTTNPTPAMSDEEEFMAWFMLQSKMPYRGAEEIARMAWCAALHQQRAKASPPISAQAGMDEQKERTAFEAWAKARGHSIYRRDSYPKSKMYMEYVDIEEHWSAWKNRAALGQSND